MVSPCCLWLVSVGFSPKPSFHLQWQISVLGLSLFLHCSSVTSRWLQLASSLCFLGGFFKVALCVRLYNEPVHVQPRTWSVYGCRKATEVRQLHTCTMYHPANFNFLVCSSLSCNLFCVSFSIRMIFLAVCCAIREIFFSYMLIFLFHFHGNGCIKANSIISHLDKTAPFQPPRFDVQHIWQVSSCNVGRCGGLRPSFFRNLLALWLSSVIRKA